MKLPRRLSDERSQAGETLIEVLMSSALMALVVVVIIGAMGTMLLGSTVHRKQTNGNAELVGAIERMKAVPYSQVDCLHTDAQRQSAYLSAAPLPAGWTATVAITYQRLTASGFDFAGTTCTSTMPLQQVTLTLKSSDSRVAPSMKFVRGDT